MQSEKKRDEINDIFKAVEIIKQNEKLDEIASRKKNLESMKSSLQALNNEGIDEEFSSKLKTLLFDRERIKKNCIQIEEKLQKAEKDIEIAEPDWSSYEGSPQDRVKKYLKKKKSMTILGLIFSILGLACGIGSFYFGQYLPFEKTVGIAVGCGLLLVGIIFMFINIGIVNKIKAIFREWGADDYDSLEESVSKNSTISRLSNALELIRISYDEINIEKNNNASEIRRMAKKVLLNSADELSEDDIIKNLIAMTEKKLAEKKELESSCAREEGTISGLEKDIKDNSSIEELSEEMLNYVSTLSEGDIKRLDTERRFHLGKIDSLRTKEIELEREVASLGAVCVSPAVLFEKHEEVKKLLIKKNDEYDELLMAIEALAAAGEKLRSGIVPNMMKKASEMMGGITEDKYDSLLSQSGGEIVCIDEKFGPHDIGCLSGGTRTLAYIAFRLAFVYSIYKNEKRPILIMDDILSFIDKHREEKCFEYLSKEECQTFLFSCRDAFSTIANSNIIKM